MMRPSLPAECDSAASLQTVIFLTKHDAEGTIGLILNRPSGVNLGAIPMPLDGADSIQSVFGENRLYFGGMAQGDVSFPPSVDTAHATSLPKQLVT